MRFLILSDIHGNREALRAVLSHVRRKRFDRILFAGDAVGYGASPNHVLDWLRSLGPQAVMVRGNHDRVCSGLDSAEFFNRYAREASEWTLDHLNSRNLDFLRALPEGPAIITPQLALCHGSTFDEDRYIFSTYEAQLGFEAMPDDMRVVFFGHTHVPSVFTLDKTDQSQTLQVRVLAGRRLVLDLDPSCRYLINPGSVGQPRDRDPRAAYAIYDDQQQRLHVYRVTYRTAISRRRIIQAGLPPVLGDRLLYGA